MYPALKRPIFSRLTGSPKAVKPGKRPTLWCFREFRATIVYGFKPIRAAIEKLKKEKGTR
jgi:hypothetical protein